MFNIGEGHFDDNSAKPSGTATPIGGVSAAGAGPTSSSARKKSSAAKPRTSGGAATTSTSKSHRRKSTKERLAYADGTSGNNFDNEDMTMDL